MANTEAVGNALISVMAFFSLSYVLYKVRKPFKEHKFNTFSYIILILLVYGMFSKDSFVLLALVRMFFVLIDNDSKPRFKTFLATYPQVNLVITSYLLSNQW